MRFVLLAILVAEYIPQALFNAQSDGDMRLSRFAQNRERQRKNGGIKMKKLVVYVHGKGGNASEAMHYKPLFAECDVTGFDYASENPWQAKEEFTRFFDEKREEYEDITLIANSIGAFFSMCSLSEKQISRAFFISPILDMEKLISDMLMQSGKDEDELRVRGEIPTDFGETLSWSYLCYVRENPIKWSVKTKILYGEFDNLTAPETLKAFSERTGSSVTVMRGGEHWFHTEKQMKFLDDWILTEK